MKKLSCAGLVLLLFCSSGIIFAQTGGVSIGVVGGPSRASLRGNSFIEQFSGPAYNYAAGFSFQYHFPEIFSIYTGVFNELKGSKSEITITDNKGVELGKAKLRNNLSYMIVPVMAKFSFGHEVKFVAGCGGYGGYLMGASSKFAGPGQPDNVVKNKSSFHDWDFGVSLSAGVSIPLKERLSLAIELQNNTGLYNIAKSNAYANDPIKTNTTNLLLGLSYRLGERGS